jgi:erythromycin esterase-like protein
MPDESRLGTADVVSDQLREQLADDRDDYVLTSSEGAWERTMRDLWSMDQAVELWRADDGDLNTAESIEIREESMAENVSWLMEHEDVDQIAIWVHNEHVRRGPLRDSEYTTDEYSNEEPSMMGSFLASEYGDGYYALGFEFGRGSFRTYDSVSTVDDIADHRELASVLTGVGDSTVATDFDSVSDPNLREFLEDTHYIYTAGVGVPGSVETVAHPYELTADLDGLLFVDETTETRRL